MNLDTLKNLDNKKKRDFAISLIIMCIILLVAFNYIFSDEKENNKIESDKINNTTNNDLNNNVEKRLASILSKIDGITDVSVMITYDKDTKLNPVYNVNEEINGKDKVIKREVVYNEEGSDKKVVIESVDIPSVEGVVVVAKGINEGSLKSKVLNAISSLTGASLHKIEIFEKGE